MKSVLNVNDHDAVLEVIQHLRDLFEYEGGCAHCGIVAPIRSCSFTVSEPIQTCHARSGKGLDANNALPPGNYLVLGHEQHRDGASHWLTLEDLRTKQKVLLCYGYSKGSCMDWRGITAYSEKDPE